jgi:hypothetical protein
LVVEWANAIEVCDRPPYDEGGRAPGPRLLARLLTEVFLDVVDCGRDDVEEANDVLRALAREVPFTTGRPCATLAFDRAGSPARSTSVFRFGSSSLTIRNVAEAACVSWGMLGQTKGPT